MSTQADLEDFRAGTPAAPDDDQDDDVERECPYCDEPVPAVRVPFHLADDCDEAPREVWD